MGCLPARRAAGPRPRGQRNVLAYCGPAQIAVLMAASFSLLVVVPATALWRILTIVDTEGDVQI